MRSSDSSWVMQDITCGIPSPALTRISTSFWTLKQVTACLHHRNSVGPSLLRVCVGLHEGPAHGCCLSGVAAVAGAPAQLVHPHLHRTICMWWTLTYTPGGLQFSKCAVIVFRDELQKGCYKTVSAR